MLNLARILFLTDFSEASAGAAKYATELADRFGAELHALHVVEEIAPALPEAGYWITLFPDYLEKARSEAEKALAASLPTDVAGKPIVRAVRQGATLVQILDYARDTKIDLIVMGTHGRTGLPHFFIGSVAERVVRHAPCPVLTVRPPEREAMTA